VVSPAADVPGGIEANFSFLPPDAGTYSFLFSVFDKDGARADATATVTVMPAAPKATFTAAGPVAAGGMVTASFSNATDSPADMAAGFTYEFDWDNDGVYETAGTNPSATHVFTQAVTHTVRGRITDQKGLSREYSTTVEVTAVKPFVTVPLSASLNEGDTLSVAGSFTDPDTGTAWSATVDYGDGSGEHTIDLNADKTFALSHNYTDNGTYTATVRVFNGVKYGDGSIQVSVANVAPTATLGCNGPVNEGSSATVSFTGGTDVSSDDVAAGLRYSFGRTASDLATTYAGAGTAT
jgi:hypothetical protein